MIFELPSPMPLPQSSMAKEEVDAEGSLHSAIQARRGTAENMAPSEKQQCKNGGPFGSPFYVSDGLPSQTRQLRGHLAPTQPPLSPPPP